VQRHAEALVIEEDAFLSSWQGKLVAQAAGRGIPTICAASEGAEADALMTFGASVADAFRLAGVYVGRILKGEKPGDLPVQSATKFELAINLKTAKALGLDIPPTLLARADKVIG
jgi:putative ABC transport system substrate-binding protein